MSAGVTGQLLGSESLLDDIEHAWAVNAGDTFTLALARARHLAGEASDALAAYRAAVKAGEPALYELGVWTIAAAALVRELGT